MVDGLMGEEEQDPAEAQFHPHLGCIARRGGCTAARRQRRAARSSSVSGQDASAADSSRDGERR